MHGTGQVVENADTLPARTALHVSVGGREFKRITQRGDDFFDWDTNMFHFYGGTPVGESLAVYEGHVQYYIEQWEKTSGGAEGLLSLPVPS